LAIGRTHEEFTDSLLVALAILTALLLSFYCMKERLLKRKVVEGDNVGDQVMEMAVVNVGDGREVDQNTNIDDDEELEDYRNSNGFPQQRRINEQARQQAEFTSNTQGGNGQIGAR